MTRLVRAGARGGRLGVGVGRVSAGCGVHAWGVRRTPGSALGRVEVAGLPVGVAWPLDRMRDSADVELVSGGVEAVCSWARCRTAIGVVFTAGAGATRPIGSCARSSGRRARVGWRRGGVSTGRCRVGRRIVCAFQWASGPCRVASRWCVHGPVLRNPPDRERDPAGAEPASGRIYRSVPHSPPDRKPDRPSRRDPDTSTDVTPAAPKPCAGTARAVVSEPPVPSPTAPAGAPRARPAARSPAAATPRERSAAPRRPRRRTPAGCRSAR
ncbi:hypothetical protein SAMN05216188_102774 [Lentzea xinjiangensis]|uniref:Uncharacterized protein n=1 Tax=Lentzea xinjiangensis TaxID=402600 RepID=A0A1H9F401_9PSEU|nr:hypothetical protein SAMN05216188_102774 [Lentzea xinjiangensis]